MKVSTYGTYGTLTGPCIARALCARELDLWEQLESLERAKRDWEQEREALEREREALELEREQEREALENMVREPQTIAEWITTGNFIAARLTRSKTGKTATSKPPPKPAAAAATPPKKMDQTLVL
uniref:Uncharacterized protein n=1 Tax=Sphaerodactylus townsendi TaxID=933632 RepID=A0ACB8ECC2_9SAUR